MANTGAKLSSFPEVNDIQTGDMFPLLSGGNTNAKIDYATLADAIIAKLKSEDVVQAQTNNANKLISAALAYSMNQDILQLKEDTSTEQEEKSVTAGIVTVEDADGGEADLTLNLEPHQSGSGDPSPDNVRPISGWTGAKVTRCGKNLCDFADIPIEANVDKVTDFPEYIDLKAGTYTLSYTLDKTVTALRNRPAYTAINGAYIYGDPDIKTAGRGSWTFTLASDTTLRFFWWGYMVSEACTIGDIQLELGSTATDYEPYSGQTYDINFPSEAGTVYGGTLDVTNGELVVDRAIIASYAGETLPTTWISDRDVYSEGATPTTGAQVVYELATPITYHLTPTEVTILMGYNTIWMDADGTIKLDYKANAIATKGDVNEAIARIKALAKITETIAPIESSYKATQNYSVGDYLIVDYKLYKVTAAIANGGTITPNTNVTATTIMAEIKALA